MKGFKTLTLCFGFILSIFFATAWAQDENLEHMIEESDFISSWRVEKVNNPGVLSKGNGYTIIPMRSRPYLDSPFVALSRPFAGTSGTALNLRVQIRCETDLMAIASLSILSSSGEKVEEIVRAIWFQNDSEWRTLAIEEFQITSGAIFYIAIALADNSTQDSSIFYVRNLSSDANLSIGGMSDTCGGCSTAFDCQYGNCAEFTDGSYLCVPWSAFVGYQCEADDDGGGGCFIDACRKQNKAVSMVIDQGAFHAPIMFKPYP